MRFFLGTHKTHWLRESGVPLFISRRALAVRKALPRAVEGWALDSGGFTELGKYGRWTVEPSRYADEASLWADRIGRLEWAAIQDWMCEPFMIEKTGLSVREHQERTIASLVELRALAPGVPWAPVVQGWRVEDYLDHAEQYRAAGVELASEPVVGVGSVCRRQSTREAFDIFLALRIEGIRCHGFGVKLGGANRLTGLLSSADSLAWSLNARKNPPLPECQHRKCSNCLRFALRWRERMLEAMGKADAQGCLGRAS